ncbi:MAG: hypothetical protein Q9188_002850 [Gyalolechia gomerana]
MHLKIAYLVLGALAAMTTANPVASTTTESAPSPERTTEVIEAGAGAAARADLRVKICTDADFKGRCQEFATNKRVCYNLNGNYADKVSSFGPSPGPKCVLWQ